MITKKKEEEKSMYKKAKKKYIQGLKRKRGIGFFRVCFVCRPRSLAFKGKEIEEKVEQNIKSLAIGRREQSQARS
jgi:hypothetical protein